MKLSNLKKSINLAKIEYVKWICDARMIMLVVLFVFLKIYSVDPLLKNAEKMKEAINVFEPFVAVVNSGIIMLIIPLVFIALIADFPKVDTNTVFYISRVGRVNWLNGQILKLVFMILSYLFIIFIGTVIPVIFKCEFSAEWSDVVTKFAIKYPEKRENFGASLIPENIYFQYTIIKAMVSCYLLVFAYLFVLGMIMLLFTTLNLKQFGFFVCSAVIAIGTGLCAANSFLMWFFPMANCILWVHYTKYFREPEFSLQYSIVYMCAAMILLVSICYIMIDRLNYNTISEIDS